MHSRGVRLHVRIQGPRNAPLVLLIHGFGGGAFEWDDVLRELNTTASTGHPMRVVAVDLRGYGRSDKTPRGYDLTTAASDMAGVIRGLGYASAIVVGHGYGGLVGWTLAAHEPERVQQLITLSSSHPVEQARQVRRRPISQWNRVKDTLYAQLPKAPEKRLTKDNAAAAERIFRRNVAPGFRDTKPYLEAARLRREAMLVDKVAHMSCEYRRWNFRSRLRPEGARFDKGFPRRVDMPVLVVDGNMNPGFSEHMSELCVQRGGPGSESVVLYGVGHYPHIEDPPAVARLISQAVAESAD